MRVLSRRAFLIATVIAAPLALVACATRQSNISQQVLHVPEEIRALYGPVINESYSLPAIDLSTIDPKFLRQEVVYYTSYPPGTLVIDTQERFLYLIGENGKALRYGIGVGKEGLEFEGEGVIQRKRKWPSWAPTAAMMAREPERYGHLGKGMPPGPDNPLGARALYLYKNGKDTLFRIHGSHESWSIGQAISSGCIRLLNQDAIDLYDRVPVGARVIVLQKNEEPSSILNQQNINDPLMSTIYSSELF